MDICRSQLALIVSTNIMQKCQELIDKVREFRYLKVRERKINKFNRLLQKREGNITCTGNLLTLFHGVAQVQAALIPSQGGAQAQAALNPPTQVRVPVPITVI